MYDMVLVNLITSDGKTIPVGMADSFEDAKKMMDYIDKLIGKDKIKDYQIISFPECRKYL